MQPIISISGLHMALVAGTVMALLRDAAVSVLHLAGIQRVAAQLRRHSQYPAEAVTLVVGPLPTGA